MAEPDQKLENEAAAAEQPSRDPGGVWRSIKAAPWDGQAKLGDLRQTSKKCHKTQGKERNEEDDLAWKGRNMQQLRALWAGPSGEGLGLCGELTVAHRVSGHTALGLERVLELCWGERTL